MAPVPGVADGESVGGAAYASDQEPNDSRSTAAALVWPAGAQQDAALPLVVQGVLSGASDTDIFVLPVHPHLATLPKQWASVQVSLAALVPHHDLRLTLLSGADRLEVNAGAGGVPELIPSVGLGGEVFLQVNASQSSTAQEAMPYKIIITPNTARVANTFGSELEPNNRLESTTPHVADRDAYLLAAWVNRADDLDIFALSIPENLPATLRVLPPKEAACALSVQLLEAPGGERSLIWEGATGQKENQPAEFLHLKPGHYFTRIKPLPGCVFPSKPLPYLLSLQTSEFRPNLPTPELEPNDDPEATHVLTLPASGRLQVQAALLTADDIDNFRINLPAHDPSAPPRLVRAVVTPIVTPAANPSATPPGRDLDLSLHAHLVEATFEQSFDNTRANQPEALCDTVAAGPTTLDLRIQNSPIAPQTPFTAPRPYLLDLLVHTPPDAEREPNDLPGIASPITTNTPTFGHIYPEGDADTFRFTLSAPDNHVTLSLHPGEPLNLSLALRDDTGEAIAQADRGQAGEPETLTADLPAGTYHATITSRHGFSCASPYTLTITSTP